jgi:hypothetical protein
VSGLELTITALAHLFPDPHTKLKHPRVHSGTEVIDEARARKILTSVNGLRFVNAVELIDDSDPTGHLDRLRAPFAVKLIADGLAHKGRVGGVRLGCLTADDVIAAARVVRAAAKAAGVDADRIRGVLVQEMVFGLEIMLGLSRDTEYGAFVSLGLGGRMAELPGSNSVRLLPSAEDDYQALARALTSEVLGLTVAEQVALVDLVAVIMAEFVSGELSEYDTVELNPIILTTDGPVAVDALLERQSHRSARRRISQSRLT